MTPLEKLLHEFKTRYSSTQFASWLNSHSEELLNEEKEYINQRVIEELEDAITVSPLYVVRHLVKRIKELKQE